MSTKYQIPEGLTKEALVDIHEEFLATNPDIRVNNRWGDYTEYSVRVSAKAATALMGIDANKDRTWRLCVGVSEPMGDGVRDDTVDIQYHDGDEWMSACFDVDAMEVNVSAVHLIATARTYLLEKYPEVEALLQIDHRLLEM